MTTKSNATLTPKQKKFVQEFQENENMSEIELLAKGLTTIYLEAGNARIKKHAAWFIKRLRPEIKLIGIEQLLDMEELNLYAIEKQKEVNAITKSHQKRRHDKRNDFALTDDEWIDAVTHFDNRCAYCGKDKKLTYDHFKAFSKGGSFDKQNILPVCKSCNSSKNNKEFSEWYPKQKFYSKNRESKIYEYIKSGDKYGCI